MKSLGYKDVCFGRKMVEDIMGLKTSGRFKLIKLLVDILLIKRMEVKKSIQN